MRGFLSFLSLVLFFSTSVFAGSNLSQGSVAPFFQHFKVEKNENGEAALVVYNSKDGAPQFSVSMIIEDLKRDLRMLRRTDFNARQALTSMWGAEALSQWPERERELAIRSLENLKNVDAEKIMEDKEFISVMNAFEGRIKANWRGFQVIANPLDPAFFHTREVVKTAVGFALNIARAKLADPWYLAMAQQVIDMAASMIEDRRTFYQNMILHYLEKFSPEELCLTAQDISKIRSSIYESRLSWYSVFQARKARKKWEGFGDAKFVGVYGSASAFLYNTRKRYDEIGDRLNYGFNDVVENGRSKIVNLIDSKFMFSQTPSDAWDYEEPARIEKQRRILRLVDFGIDFIPVVPGMVKSVVSWFLNSMYYPQGLTEGALLAFFESNYGMADDQAKQVVLQSLNAFVIADLKTSAQ